MSCVIYEELVENRCKDADLGVIWRGSVGIECLEEWIYGFGLKKLM